MSPVLEARGLCVGWRGRPVLSDVDLSLARGERFALVGSNGSGKTTLLRALAGLERPLSGSVCWLGAALPQGPARVAVLGVLLQDEQPSRFLVRELVALGLRVDAAPSPREEAAVASALAVCDLAPLAERSCASLSGGESRRTLLARAGVARPRVLLLDEPTNHLDPARQAELLGHLARLRGETALVISTHDLSLAATCDRVALLHRGRVEMIGAPREVLTPARLSPCLGARVQRLDDPGGGPPFFRVHAGRIDTEEDSAA